MIFRKSHKGFSVKVSWRHILLTSLVLNLAAHSSCDVTNITNVTGVLLHMPTPPSTGEQTVFLTTNQLLEGTTMTNINKIPKKDQTVKKDMEMEANITSNMVDGVTTAMDDKEVTAADKITLTTTEGKLGVKPIDDPEKEMIYTTSKKPTDDKKHHVVLPSASPVPPVSHSFQATPGDLCPAFEEADRFTQTELLSRLTNDCRYDRLERPLGPANGAGPLPVAARIYVYFIQNTEAHDLSFSVTILLQFRYQDARLAYHDVAPSRTVIMGESQLRDKIWVPHVFVSNERSSQVMGTDAQSKDVLVSVAPDGTVVFSVRMKATLYCWMNLRKFPFDEQQCSVVLESWKYNTSELLLTWEPRAPVTLAPELHLTEYVLTDMWVNETIVRADLDDLRHGAFGGTYSALSFTVQLSREMGFYLMDYFIPSMMIVAISWVSFWLAADQSAPRITLGTSTMLTFITLASAQGKTLPKVSYIKASEIWFLGCTGFIFGSLVEFAFVNTIWRRKKNVELKKVNSKYILKSTLTPRLARKEFNASRLALSGGSPGGPFVNAPLVKARSCSSLDSQGAESNDGRGGLKNYLTVHSFNKVTLPKITTQSADDLVNDDVSVVVDGSPGGPGMENGEPQEHHTWTTMTPQEISMWIDTRSRLVFPVAFIVFNAFYWIFVYYM